MSARDDVLSRVRRAQAIGVRQPGPAPRDYRRAGEGVVDAEGLVSLLVDRLTDYRAVITRTASADAAAAISAALSRHDARRVVVPDGFPAAAVPGDLEVVLDDPLMPAAQLDALDAVLTTSVVAIAETGTVVLDAGPGMGRRALTLVPDLHVLVVRIEDVVRGVPEALTRLDPRRPLTWISGPSATSDIELDRVEGVHGPRRLEVVLLEA